MFGESLWNDSLGPLGLGANFSLSNVKAEPMPTPPHSPHGLLLDDMEFPFSNGEFVDPNSILDVYRGSSSSGATSTTRPDLEDCNSSFPIDLGDIDIKMEPLESFLGGGDLNMGYAIDRLTPCPHEPSLSRGMLYCPNCVEDSFKTEIVNDCMWTSGTAVDPDCRAASNSFSSVVPPVEGGALPPRTHLDSTASRFSDLADLMVGVVPSMEDDDDDLDPEDRGCLSQKNAPHSMQQQKFAKQLPSLETPSESSDTDTDLEDFPKTIPSAAHTVNLDHNYHVTTGAASSIAHPLMRALHKVSSSTAVQTDSDDEIDVVNLTGTDTLDLTEFASGYSSTGSFSSVRGDDEVLVSSSRSSSSSPSSRVMVGGGLNKARRLVNGAPSSSSTGRRVGRPCKNPKRLSHHHHQSSYSNNVPTSSSNIRRYSTSTSTTLSADPKRSLHNSMERMRRVNLRNCFDAVRCAVPSLRGLNRAPKVLILKSAVDMIRSLETGEGRKKVEAEQLRLYQAALLVKLQKLKEERGMG